MDGEFVDRDLFRVENGLLFTRGFCLLLWVLPKARELMNRVAFGELFQTRSRTGFGLERKEAIRAVP